MYKKVTIDGKTEDVESLTLKEMQEFVGGYIEQHREFFINEDGLMLGLPRNKMFPRYVGNVIIQI